MHAPLAAMCEIFGGALVGGHTTHDGTLQQTSAIVNGMLSVPIDPNAFDAADADGIPVDRATWRQIRDSAAAVGFADAELDAWTRRCTERA
ncbi:hypothetical protein [Burkholderia ubonensis]|uniref:hypothetical protein n=1 Tax=Burkholderia ubonensis TaxID=101571 RepID=UPI00075912B6|nr:hypothetical protein WJ82_22955 [Burkholderia ubonensis]KVQ13483.1 hypothetical protein WJ98_25920 [Burkholderia ubonensis]KVU66188.1 hypothetical protein WK71_18410 [Burkholderia ubonensis]KVU92322.1 hypothetical protein WK76_12735 [Burkholderia ubonensis]OJB40423.1 hypothetical protein BGV56_01115 [Burkholderia ubonensis]